MRLYQHLAVALARTDSDRAVLRYATKVARHVAAQRVDFVHVLPSVTGPETAKDHAEVLRELQNAVKCDCTGMPETTEVSCDVLHGAVLDKLLTYAAENQVDVLFVGQAAEPSSRKTLTRRLAMKAPCSVWLVPEDGPTRLRRILIPVDFSEHAADAVCMAASLARLNGGIDCIALHVYFNDAVTTYDGYDEVLRGRELEAYREFISPIDRQNVRLTPMFEEGVDVAHVIDRVAKELEVDLIVMATRGRSRSAAILLGSVTEEMIWEACVPMLVVKHFGARLGVLQALLDRRFRERGDVHTD